jgi:DNA-binding SARP family transcriptional activator
MQNMLNGCSSEIELIVVEGLPVLDGARAKRFSNFISTASQNDIDIVLSAPPKAAASICVPYGCEIIRADELVFTDAEVARLAKNCGSTIVGAQANSVGCGLPPIMFTDDAWQADIAARLSLESLTDIHFICAFAILAFGEGDFKDIDALISEIAKAGAFNKGDAFEAVPLQKENNSQEIYEMLIELARDYPFLGINTTKNTFKSISLELPTLFKYAGGQFCEAIKSIWGCSGDVAAEIIADMLCARGSLVRGCDVAEGFMSRAAYSKWLTDNTAIVDEAASVVGSTALLKPSAEAPSDDVLLEVNLFGGIEIRLEGEPVNLKRFTRKKSLTLLALLILHKGNFVSRSKIAEALWPGGGVDAFRRNFYCLSSQLRTTLAVEGARPLLEFSDAGCRLDVNRVRSDVFDFNKLCSEMMFPSEEIYTWEEVLDDVTKRFSCEFMPSEDRCANIVAARDSFKAKLVDALVAASEHLNLQNEPRGALWFAREALDRDDLREDVYIALIEAQIALNQRSAAIETYFACRRILCDKLGLDPSVKLMELYNSVLQPEELLLHG